MADTASEEISALASLCKGLASFQPETVNARRASVAAIIRYRSSYASNGDSSFPPVSSVGAFLELPWVRDDPDGEAEILFIRRATRATDRWSGHVAFPGGKNEPGETDLDTAIREVQEEIGLDLESEAFIQIGQLDEREIVSTFDLRAAMILVPFVFLQVVPQTPPMHLQTTEVAAVQWVPLHFFLSNKPYTRQPSMAKILVPRQLGMFKRLGRWALGTMSLPAVDMPTDEANGPPFRLWGLTLRMTRDIIELLLLGSGGKYSGGKYRLGYFIALAQSEPMYSRSDVGFLAHTIARWTLLWRQAWGAYRGLTSWRFRREAEKVYYASVRTAVFVALTARLVLAVALIMLLRRKWFMIRAIITHYYSRA